MGVFPNSGSAPGCVPSLRFLQGLVLLVPCAVLLSVLLQSRGDVQLVTRFASLEGSQSVGTSGVHARGRGAD